MQMTKVQGLNWFFRKFRGELALLGKSSGTLLPILPNINVGDHLVAGLGASERMARGEPGDGSA
jgi:hypothetical protein